MPKPIIIDCDPGQDDAIMLLLAFASPAELDIRGITTVAGNVPLDLTQRNARIICELGSRTEIPVYAGCSRPMVRDLVTAEAVHGQTGLDGIDIYEPEKKLEIGHGVDFIVDRLMAAGEAEITLVPTGPLTNIAMAMVLEPRILPKIAEIVFMGGAMREAGNTSPSAEFNMLVDPHAAHRVMTCGRPITAFGLDATHQVITTPERLSAIAAVGGPVARAAHDMLELYDRHDMEKYGSPGGPLHDPCTIAYLIEPDLFEGRQVNVTIDLGSELTIGHTAVDYWRVTDRPKNVNWIAVVDADGFYRLLTERLARI